MQGLSSLRFHVKDRYGFLQMWGLQEAIGDPVQEFRTAADSSEASRLGWCDVCSWEQDK